MTTIEKIKKYSPPSLDEMIQRSEKKLEELKTYNKLDIIAFNLIRGFQNRSNYEETIRDIKDFGIFVSLDGNVDALIRKEDIGSVDIDSLKIGDKIEAAIAFIDEKKNRIRLCR